jgi:hypothetical protein
MNLHILKFSSDITCVDPIPEKRVKEAIGSRVTLVDVASRKARSGESAGSLDSAPGTGVLLGRHPRRLAGLKSASQSTPSRPMWLQEAPTGLRLPDVPFTVGMVIRV